MKNIIRFSTVCLALLTTLLFHSCRKAPINGDLDGQWKVVSIENRNSGSISAPGQSLFICINLHVVQLTPANFSGNMTYDQKQGVVTWDFPYGKPELNPSVNPDAYQKKLKWYGIPSNPVTLKVSELNGKRLVLLTDSTVITCKRF